ncbi:hypothetical protein DF047_24825 [Burkholderia cenocepacia]|nr:hypothetical protein DF047_24825 [Burkholderia cenocepacia]
MMPIRLTACWRKVTVAVPSFETVLWRDIECSRCVLAKSSQSIGSSFDASRATNCKSCIALSFNIITNLRSMLRPRSFLKFPPMNGFLVQSCTGLHRFWI